MEVAGRPSAPTAAYELRSRLWHNAKDERERERERERGREREREREGERERETLTFRSSLIIQYYIYTFIKKKNL